MLDGARAVDKTLLSNAEGSLRTETRGIMNKYDVKRLGLIFAMQAQIEGMKAENIQCVDREDPLIYEEVDFSAKAKELRFISHCRNDQL